MAEDDYLVTALLNWGLGFILLGIVIYIWRAISKLANARNRKGWVFALMGFATFIIGNAAGLIIYLSIITTERSILNVGHTLFWLACWLLAPFGLYMYLKNRWKSNQEKEIES